jgi:hypothetical protein
MPTVKEVLSCPNCHETWTLYYSKYKDSFDKEPPRNEYKRMEYEKHMEEMPCKKKDK